jgi:hypothetical protein
MGYIVKIKTILHDVVVCSEYADDAVKAKLLIGKLKLKHSGDFVPKK